MDQLNMTENVGARMLRIDEDLCWLRIIYSRDRIIDHEVKLMSYDDTFNYALKSEKTKIMFDLPETIADLDHIEKIMKVCAGKMLVISSELCELNGMTGPLCKLAMKKCLEKEKNTITLRYIRDIYTFGENSHDSDKLSIASEFHNFRLQILYDDNFLFPQLVECLKVLKNQNQFVVIEMKTHFKKLFEAMKWTFDAEMVNWINGNMRTDAIIMDFLDKTIDNCEYQIQHEDYGLEEDSDTGSVTSDESSCATEDTGDLSSDDEEPSPKKRKVAHEPIYAENVKPVQVESFYINDNGLALTDLLSAESADTGLSAAGAGLLGQPSAQLAQLVVGRDVFGRVPSKTRFLGLPAFYDPESNTQWDGEQGWTWDHEDAGIQAEHIET